MRVFCKTKAQVAESVSLRTVVRSDRAFLYELFAMNHIGELNVLGVDTERMEPYLMSQFSIQYRRFEKEFITAEMEIVLLDGQPVGRVYFECLDDEIYLVDLALLPDNQGQGLGTDLLNVLKKEAKQRALPIIAEVEEHHPALSFFEAAGFAETGKEESYVVLEWRAP